MGLDGPDITTALEPALPPCPAPPPLRDTGTREKCAGHRHCQPLPSRRRRQVAATPWWRDSEAGSGISPRWGTLSVGGACGGAAAAS